MGNKRSKKIAIPNAPALDEILLHQNSQQNHFNSAPPPYSMSTSPSSPLYPQIPSNYIVPYMQQPSMPSDVVVEQPVQYINIQSRKIKKKVRKYNVDLFFIALLAAVSSLLTIHWYSYRKCYNYTLLTVLDRNITMSNLLHMELAMLVISAFLMIISLIQCCSCSNTHGGYISTVTLVTFLGLLICCATTYMSFYATCAGTLTETVQNAFDTVRSLFGVKLPPPGDRIFGKLNVFEVSREDDPYGRTIFLNDLFRTIMFFSMFTSVAGLV